MTNELLRINWCDVKMVTFEGAKIMVATAAGHHEITFASEAELRAAFREWVRSSEEVPFVDHLVPIKRP